MSCPILGLFPRFCECLVRNVRFGRVASAFWEVCFCVFANVSHEFLRMSRAKRSFSNVCFCVFANVSYKTLLFECLLLRFCKCLVPNARFGKFASAFFANVSPETLVLGGLLFCVFANVSHETLVLGGLLLRFCECLVRNARFQRFASAFLRMSRTKRSFANVSFFVNK